MTEPTMADEWMVAANETGRARPLVFTHTWHYEDAHLRQLGAAVGSDQPLYGIEPPDGSDGPLPTRVEQWVDFHLDRLQRLPVSPPYWLGGFSFGGVVALELARRLQASGVDVEYLAMIDTVRPKINPIGLSRYVEVHLRELLDVPAEKRGNYLRRTARGSWSRTKSRAKRQGLRMARQVGLRPDAPTTLGDVKKMSPLVRAIHRSYLNYEAVAYEHPVALFHSAESLARADGDISLRWARYLPGGFDNHAIRGAHLQIFDDDNVDSVAGALTHSMAMARARRDLSMFASQPKVAQRA